MEKTERTNNNFIQIITSCVIVAVLLVSPLVVTTVTLVFEINKLDLTDMTLEVQESVARLNAKYINDTISSYLNFIIPCIAILVTLMYCWDTTKNIEKSLKLIIIHTITEFVVMASILCNFNSYIGTVKIISNDDGIYYTATSMIEYLAIAFITYAIMILCSKITNKEHTHNELVKLQNIKEKQDEKKRIHNKKRY